MKEKILEILKSYSDYHYLVEIDRTAYVIGDHAFEDIAEAIKQLKIECPDQDEIEMQSIHYAHEFWEQEAFKEGAKYIKNEIAKRNNAKDKNI